MGSLDSSSFRHGHWAAPFNPCPSVSRSVRGGHVKSQEGLFLPPHRGLDPTDRGADPPAREERRRSSSSRSVGIELTCAPQTIYLQPCMEMESPEPVRAEQEVDRAGRSMEPRLAGNFSRFDYSGFVSSARIYVDCPTCPYVWSLDSAWRPLCLYCTYMYAYSLPFYFGCRYLQAATTRSV